MLSRSQMKAIEYVLMTLEAELADEKAGCKERLTAERLGACAAILQSATQEFLTGR